MWRLYAWAACSRRLLFLTFGFVSNIRETDLTHKFGINKFFFKRKSEQYFIRTVIFSLENPGLNLTLNNPAQEKML